MRHPLFYLARFIGELICKPQVWIGRHRHDGTCDCCGEPIGQYAGEALDFPLDSLDPDASTPREKVWAMLRAEYVRVCLECTDRVRKTHRGLD